MTNYSKTAKAPVRKMADGGSVGFWERLKAGNIDQEGSEANKRWGSGSKAEDAPSPAPSPSPAPAPAPAESSKPTQEFLDANEPVGHDDPRANDGNEHRRTKAPEPKAKPKAKRAPAKASSGSGFGAGAATGAQAAARSQDADRAEVVTPKKKSIYDRSRDPATPHIEAAKDWLSRAAKSVMSGTGVSGMKDRGFADGGVIGGRTGGAKSYGKK